MKQQYDIVVIGAGHAGCEAALAAARLGCRTALLVMNADTIAALSCNPAVGGLAKGHLVKEIDALGGEMARNIDATAIQFRQLNTSKGPAVRSSRAQADRLRYRLRMKTVLENQENLEIRQTTADRLLFDHGRICGIETSLGEKLNAPAVIITTGTFFNGLIHIGLKQFPAGRLGDPSSLALPRHLKELGLSMGRMKTGTPPRLDGGSIDFTALQTQFGDNPPQLFSFANVGKCPELPQLPCHVTYTSAAAHEIIRAGCDRSPMFTGIIQGVGARYCPSVEDKIMRFPDKDRHQIFLEPEGLDTVEIYPNGLSTSLPFDIQVAMLRAIKGLDRVRIIRPGYAIEYDYVDPLELQPWLECKKIPGLFLAGQINGTSGYEEAAAQGLMAGINAVRLGRRQEPLVLDRSQAYIGVLIDDLVTKGTREPYRLFTSRAEYRLLLREDNADFRLCAIGREIGLLDNQRYAVFSRKQAIMTQLRQYLEHTTLRPQPSLDLNLAAYQSAPLRQKISLAELLKRPELNIAAVLELAAADGKPLMAAGIQGGNDTWQKQREWQEVELEIKYAGYIARQKEQVQRFRKLEAVILPEGLRHSSMPGLSREVVEKLETVQPRTLGQAARIAGITPAAIAVLQIHLKRGVGTILPFPPNATSQISPASPANPANPANSANSVDSTNSANSANSKRHPSREYQPQ
ncbi:MAG: tRNA uridine-5-carboxymethylaminomethyl(34) synthesis enzyme MnmG [Desulfobulbaceae bacterium]|nr:MAG: tRNA uridine-5-carboxymethylaminomethyl(34) synthesis enzyme MnmG [Desulfobulbaceae bacterium]